MIRDLTIAVPPETSRVARECLLVAQAAEVNVEELSKRISQDVGLTVDLMKVANSAALGSLRPAKSIKEAVCRIGLLGVRQVLSDHALRNSVKFEPAGFFTFATFARHSAFVGLLANELCSRVDKSQAATLHLAGLLHDVGLGVIATVDREHIVSLTDQASKLSKSFEDVEATLGAISHRVLGAHVLELWKLPAEVCRLVKIHDVREQALRGKIGKEENRLADVLLLADMLGHTRHAKLEPVTEDAAFVQGLATKLGLGAAKMQEAEQQALSLMEAYFPQST